MITIVLVDIDAHLPAAQVLAGAAALQRQVSEHFAPIWGDTCTVRVGTPQPGDWILELADMPPPDVQGALGIHQRDGSGNPILHVYAGLCARQGISWTSCASHEILEALADPDCVWCADTKSGMYSLEVADPVESCTYQIDGVEVSNFVCPSWYAPSGVAGEKFDYCGKLTSAFEILPGGYAQTKGPDGWATLGQMREYRKILHDLGLSRQSRR